MNGSLLPADRRAVNQTTPAPRVLWTAPKPTDPDYALWYEREQILDATTPELPNQH